MIPRIVKQKAKYSLQHYIKKYDTYQRGQCGCGTVHIKESFDVWFGRELTKEKVEFILDKYKDL